MGHTLEGKRPGKEKYELKTENRRVFFGYYDTSTKKKESSRRFLFCLNEKKNAKTISNYGICFPRINLSQLPVLKIGIGIIRSLPRLIMRISV